MTKIDLFLNALQQSGFRITAQRRAICEYLAHTDQHPTPSQVYTDVTATHPEISRATVYNTLKTLQQLGVIVEVSLGADHTHYDTDTEPHANLICLRCHAIEDYHGDLGLEDLHDDVQTALDFQPVAARIDLLGFCRACRDQRKAEIIAQWDAEREATIAGSDPLAATPSDPLQSNTNTNEEKDQLL